MDRNVNLNILLSIFYFYINFLHLTEILLKAYNNIYMCIYSSIFLLFYNNYTTIHIQGADHQFVDVSDLIVIYHLSQCQIYRKFCIYCTSLI